MKRVLVFTFCLVAFGLVAQVIYQPHRRNAFRTTTTAAFQPSDVAGLVLWLDANAIGSPTNQVGYLVTNWYDRSASGYTLRNAASGGQPYYTNNVNRIGGKPWLQFDGNDDFLVCATTPPLYVQPHTIFIAFYHQFITANIFLFSSTNATYLNRINYDTANRITMYNGATLLGLTGILSNQWYLLELTVTNGGSQIITNGVSNRSGDTGTLSWSGFRIGDYAGTGINHFGGIAEILFYNANVAAGDRTSIRSYFTTKYGAYANW